MIMLGLRFGVGICGVLIGSCVVLAAGIQPIIFRGMCDASAAVGLDRDYFAAANDEDNLLRFYRLSQAGDPIQSTNLARVLGLRKKAAEMDLEGAARLGSRVFMITSHGRNAEGKPAPQRHHFFALDIQGQEGRYHLSRVGRSYTNLVTDLVRNPRMSHLGLEAAAAKAPKDANGLNIEGLTDTPEGHLLIGFRNPVPGGKALLIPLLNPYSVIEGRLPAFGSPILLTLGGLGVRGLGSLPDGRYYVIAGSAGVEGDARLYFWKGGTAAPEPAKQTVLPGWNPEGVCFHDSGQSQFLLISDDGTRRIGGQECKQLPESERQFRAFLMGH